MAQRNRGIGYNPILNNTYQNNDQNNLYDMAQNSDRYNNYNYYDSALPYNENLTNENFGKSLAGSVGHFNYGNRRLPPMLDPTGQMGASNYQAPPRTTVMDNDFDAEWSNTYEVPEKTGILQNIKNKFSGITTPLMALLQSQKNNPEEVFGLKNFPTREGRVNYHPNDSLYAGMNVATGFGKGLSGAGEKRIGRIEDTIAGIKGGKWSQLEEDDPSAYAAKLRFHEEKLKRFKAEQAAYQADLAAQTGQGGTTIVPPDTGGKTTYSGPATTDWKPSGSYGAAQGTKGSWTPGGTITAPSASGGYQQKQGSHHYKVGGRIGYQGGELVDEDINIQGPDFDVNENMEMAEGPSPFEMRIQELVDEGLSWQEAYTIAAEEFGMAEGQEDSFSEEGIASLV